MLDTKDSKLVTDMIVDMFDNVIHSMETGREGRNGKENV
jgi:hypothetical protein